jgi:hypothetical protein
MATKRDRIVVRKFLDWFADNYTIGQWTDAELTDVIKRYFVLD